MDVLQIFGRAGRPQFESSGEGIIITSYDKLHHYLSLLTNQFPIESNFIKYLADNLNAEVSDFNSSRNYMNIYISFLDHNIKIIFYAERHFGHLKVLKL